jgi:PUA-domain protein
MAQKYRRHSLKSKESKAFLREVIERFKFDLEAAAGHKVNVEVVEGEAGKLILIDSKPLLFDVDGTVFPTLLFSEFLEQAPKIVVDMGAVPFVCKGADVMAPGIVKVDGEFVKSDLVVVVDVKHGKPLALGEAMFDSETLKATKKGAVVKNMHYVSDKVWNIAKTVST